MYVWHGGEPVLHYWIYFGLIFPRWCNCIGSWSCMLWTKARWSCPWADGHPDTSHYRWALQVGSLTACLVNINLAYFSSLILSSSLKSTLPKIPLSLLCWLYHFSFSQVIIHQVVLYIWCRAEVRSSISHVCGTHV